jgi:DNA-damage-inducible protein D
MSDNSPFETPSTSPFDTIRQLTEDGSEYWSARDLSAMLDYTQWRNFKQALEKAKIACQGSGSDPAHHFAASSKKVKLGSGAVRKVEDFQLSRYACYLVVQNADPNKEIVALGQTYFAAQTRRQELAEAGQLSALPEDRRRLVLRSEMHRQDTRLAQAARQAGVTTPSDLDEFQEHGYQGLCGELNRPAIKERKGLPTGQDLLDYAGSEELAANFFRATQTEAKLRRENIQGKGAANATHHQIGRKVRELITEVGNPMPEDLPAARESIQELEQKERKRLEAGFKLDNNQGD